MSYKKLPIWENRRRVELLHKFRELFVSYYNNLQPGGFAQSLVENAEAQQTRVKINLVLQDVRRAIVEADCYSAVRYREAPIAGGRVYTVDPIANLFFLHQNEMAPNFVTDPTETAIGVYEGDRIWSLIRTFNPLWWAWQLISWLASLPFAMLGSLGFNRIGLENSVFGRLFKLFAEVSILAVALLQIDEIAFDGRLLDWLELHIQ